MRSWILRVLGYFSKNSKGKIISLMQQGIRTATNTIKNAIIKCRVVVIVLNAIKYNKLAKTERDT